MDSCHNSSEKLPPLFARRKRVTPHQLNKSLRKMGFRSWTSFLPGDYYAWYDIVDKSMCLKFSIMTSRSQLKHFIPLPDPFMAICNFILFNNQFSYTTSKKQTAWCINKETKSNLWALISKNYTSKSSWLIWNKFLQVWKYIFMRPENAWRGNII